MPCCSITNQRLVSPGACSIATGACSEIGSKTWLVVTVMAAGGGGAGGGADDIDAVPLPPPQDDNDSIDKNESAGQKLANRPCMSCPWLSRILSSIALFGVLSQCHCSATVKDY